MNAFIEEFDNVDSSIDNIEEVNTDDKIIKKSITYNELMSNIYKDCNFYKTINNNVKYGDDVILTINGIILLIIDVTLSLNSK